MRVLRRRHHPYPCAGTVGKRQRLGMDDHPARAKRARPTRSSRVLDTQLRPVFGPPSDRLRTGLEFVLLLGAR